MSEAKDEAKEQGDYSQAEPLGTVIPANKEAHIGNLRGSAVTLDDLVAVSDDVWQEYYQEGSKRPSYRLVAAAGSIIARSHLDTLGVKVKGDVQEETAVHGFGAGTPGQTDALNSAIDGRDEQAAKDAEKDSKKTLKK